jgi:uncharacterized protein YndB with AHSA1/START domain
MSDSKIIVQAIINDDSKKVWEYYTAPEHIIHLNFADPSWQCPSAENDLRVDGTYNARMEAMDGSFGFDIEAIYSEIMVGEQFPYGFGDRS